MISTFAPVAGAAAAAAEEAAPLRQPEGQDTIGGGVDFEMGEGQNAPASGNRQ